jgi:hypothetical protein
MREQRIFFMPTLVISVLVGIVLPLAITSRPIDWKRFSYIMAMGFTLVWVIYSIILFAYVFLYEGRHRKKESKTGKKGATFFLHSTKEWEALWEITIKREDWNRKKIFN